MSLESPRERLVKAGEELKQALTGLATAIDKLHSDSRLSQEETQQLTERVSQVGTLTGSAITAGNELWQEKMDDAYIVIEQAHLRFPFGRLHVQVNSQN